MSSMQDIDKALAEMQQLAGKKPADTMTSSGSHNDPASGIGRWLRRWVFIPVLVLTLPFVALLRGSTALYTGTQWHVWLCILTAGLGATLLLTGGSWLIVRRLGWRLSAFWTRSLMLIVAGFTVYTLLYISVDNVKTGDIRATYQSLHPLLRLSGGTLFMLDGSSVVTDTGRTRDDYARMGLPVNESSLHFGQEDGYVHAFDLRTQGRAEWRNRATQLWFSSLGLRTIRHVGTADHLHISLPAR
jgi:hypothetical protein